MHNVEYIQLYLSYFAICSTRISSFKYSHRNYECTTYYIRKIKFREIVIFKKLYHYFKSSLGKQTYDSEVKRLLCMCETWVWCLEHNPHRSMPRRLYWIEMHLSDTQFLLLKNYLKEAKTKTPFVKIKGGGLICCES